MSIYTLKELNEMMYNLQQLILDGADEEELKGYMDTISLEREAKLEGYAMVIKNLENENAGIKAEEERFAKRRKYNENAIARMKERMAETLETVEPDAKGVKRLKTEKFTFSFRKSTSVQIENDAAIPPQFIKVEKTISRAELAKALKAGKQIEGAQLVENQSLQIK
ncbi:siphovirus Gp157 family protein [Lysinibacillus varians]|uniref:Siphovirus Gp157 family protein n=1 Tax=Lysinibacillus varians TaxID=1145276 RepID=A0ABY2TGG2_9BACI|nr:siphovirus Gp157 family protein [Lysinibacillus varians]AHN24369.1 hypothetical protein T479_16375 [Lysinibacillus varians]TKI66086.1 siphovirus Gp157 family protein [Lysinibacillus varians]